MPTNKPRIEILEPNYPEIARVQIKQILSAGVNPYTLYSYTEIIRYLHATDNKSLNLIFSELTKHIKNHNRQKG